MIEPLDYIRKMVDWHERDAGINRALAEDKLAQGDAGALFARGRADASQNTAAMLWDYLTAHEKQGDK